MGQRDEAFRVATGVRADAGVDMEARTRHRRLGLEYDYIQAKNDWLDMNPCASPEEIARAFRKIAHDLGL